MQTFLPYNDFARSAAVLDSRRLGKQRVEAYTILRVLAGEVKGWANHPAVRMWKGCEYELTLYIRNMCWEWLQPMLPTPMQFPYSYMGWCSQPCRNGTNYIVQNGHNGSFSTVNVRSTPDGSGSLTGWLNGTA